MTITIAEALDLSFARLEAIVRGAMPLKHDDMRFVTHESSDGEVTPLEKLRSGFRYFQWRHAQFKVRDSGNATCKVPLPLVLRIRYDRDSPAFAQVELERLIQEDLLVIDSALRRPADWQMGTTGIRVVKQDGEPGTTHYPTNGPPHLFSIVGVPYLLILEACC